MVAKAELHCHLEGSIAPPLAIELARRNGTNLPAGLMRVDGTYEWQDFLGFLAAYDGVCSALRTPGDFSDVIYTYLAGAARQGAVYVDNHHARGGADNQRAAGKADSSIPRLGKHILPQAWRKTAHDA